LGEVFIPRIQQVCSLLGNDTLNSTQFRRAKPQTVIVLEWIEPKLGYCVVPRDMDVRRFTSIRRVEEEPIRTAPQNRGHPSTWRITPQFSGRALTLEARRACIMK
jgi:hypothetical protein